MQKGKKAWATQAHHTWQIDCKEQVQIATGELLSWINIADEATTAHLMARVQKTKSASQISLKTATRCINDCFTRWGLPNQIKIDNGYPFVNPHYMDIPSLAKLWWIGLGIEVIQNTPGRPQENGAVECLQGICKRWTGPTSMSSAQQLQDRLDEESDFQRNHYQIPKYKNQTRIELYPQLEQPLRVFNSDLFEMQGVWDYLADQVWQRRIKQIGSVHFLSHQIHIGKKYGNQDTYITFDSKGKQWIFRDRKGAFLSASSKAVPSEEKILDFAIMSKN